MVQGYGQWGLSSEVYRVHVAVQVEQRLSSRHKAGDGSKMEGVSSGQRFNYVWVSSESDEEAEYFYLGC